jgi:DNA-directed RNA polymerase specialized sigma24 family protein
MAGLRWTEESVVLRGFPAMPFRTSIDHARWPTTQWEVVDQLSPESAETARHRALEKLCRAYNAPILAYLHQMGFSRHDSEDVRQRFFGDVVLRRNLLGRARRHRGRLRDLIRRSLRNYALNVLRDRKTAVRGGREDTPDSEIDSSAGCTVQAESPGEIFMREWGRGVIERAQEQIEEEYRDRGREVLCEALKPHLIRWSSPPSQDEVARGLGISATGLSTELSRLRQRFRHVLLLLLSEEGGSPQDAERTLHDLLRAFAR